MSISCRLSLQGFPRLAATCHCGKVSCHKVHVTPKWVKPAQLVIDLTFAAEDNAPSVFTFGTSPFGGTLDLVLLSFGTGIF